MPGSPGMEERSQSRGSSPSFSTQTTQDTHTAEEGRKLEGAKQEILFLQTRGSNFLSEEIGWNGGLRLLPEETAGASLAFAAVAAFMHSASKARFFTGPSRWVLAMQGTLPQVLLMLNGQ